jgi:hypothetical protein
MDGRKSVGVVKFGYLRCVDELNLNRVGTARDLDLVDAGVEVGGYLADDLGVPRNGDHLDIVNRATFGFDVWRVDIECET